MGDSLKNIQVLALHGSIAEGGEQFFYKDLVDNLYDGVYFVDSGRKITYWNRGAERLTGFLSSEIVGRNCFDNLLAHVDDNGCALCTAGCPLKETIDDGVPREAEVYLRHRLGHRVPISVRVAPIRDTRGATVGAVEIFTDITAEKKLSVVLANSSK